MQVDILEQPANTVAKVTFSQGEELTAEGGSMVAMSSGLDIKTTTHKRGSGGIMKALKRAVGGESFFLNHYKCTAPEATVYIAPALSGDIMVHELTNCNLVVQGTSFLAEIGDVDVDLGWQGFKSIFSGEGLFWLKLSGRGKALINSFGKIYPIEVDGEYIVDTSHIVAFEDTLKFNISKVGGSWLGSFLGGEGFVCRFKGKGKVWCQSHAPRSFGLIIGPMLRPR